MKKLRETHCAIFTSLLLLSVQVVSSLNIFNLDQIKFQLPQIMMKSINRSPIKSKQHSMLINHPTKALYMALENEANAHLLNARHIEIYAPQKAFMAFARCFIIIVRS